MGLSDSILGKTTEQALKSPLNKPGDSYSLSQDILSPDPKPNFGMALNYGSKKDSGQASRIIKAREKTGLPEDHIERNLEEVERNSRLSDIDIDRMSKSAPKVAEWMAKSPNHAAAGYNDLTSLNYLELQLRNIKNKFVEGRRTIELADIGESAFLGSVTPEQRKRQAEIEEELSKQEDLGIDGFFEGIPGAVSNQLPILAKTIGGQIQGAAVGGSTGAAIGAGTALVAGQLGPQVAAPEEIVTVPSAALAGGSRGAIAGWRYGAAVQAARLEASLAYLDYEKITDENGKKIERSTAIGAATMVGVINGALEFVGFEALTKAVPGLRNLQRKGMRQALKNPVVRSALTTYAKNIGEAVTTEGLTEFMQEIVTQSGGEISKMVADGESVSLNDFLGRVFSDDNIAQAIQAGKAGAQAGSGISIGAGAVSTAIDIRKAKQAQQQAEQIKKTGDVVESMKLTETNPESVEQIVENITEGGEMYIPSDTFQTYWQQQGVDPREVVQDVLGNTEQYDQAVESGQDIVIPSSKYYTSKNLGGGEHKEFFANEVRTNPMEMNAREWQEEIQSLDEQEQLVQNENAANDVVVDEKVQNIRQNIKEQLVESGFDNRTADSYAQLFESTFASLSERTGTDPMELFERFKPEINKLDNEQTKTFLQRVTDGVKSVFQKGSNSTGLDQFADASKKIEADQFRDATKKITNTKEFKNWFGESKVVDESGSPLVVYHGTDRPGFDSFEGGYSFFTDDKEVANTYQYGKDGEIYSSYLSLNRPLIIDAKGKNYQDISGGKSIDIYAKEAKESGEYDGLIVRNVKDAEPSSSVEKESTVYVAFEPTQIKSVNNRGTFDPNDPRIMFQKTDKAHIGKLLSKEKLGFDTSLDQFTDAGKKVTETKAFKDWFGDSKVVDEAGKPLVVYHGSPDVRGILSSGFESSSTRGNVFFFSDDFDVSDTYADDRRAFDFQNAEPNTIPLYLSLKNPMVIDAKGGNWRETEKYVKKAKELGHDGIIIKNTRDEYNSLETGSKGKISTVYAVFNPKQIKSAGKGNLRSRIDGTDLGDIKNRGTFDPNDPRILFQDKNQVTRGAFRFGNGTFNIDLLEGANLSTFLHETGHFYLEVLGEIMDSGNFTDQIKSDYETILNWLGVDERSQIKTEHHEKFARGFEAYLMEGKAPSTALRRIFARFKVWLTQIYSTLKNLNVELTDDVRGVFDRLVATDQQIAEVEGEINIKPLFDDTTILGSKAEKYEQAIQDYRNTVSEQATDKLMKEYQREQKQWYKDELNSIRLNVEQELNQSRTYLAWFALRKGTLPDGTEYTADTLPPKLDRKAVEKVFGKDRTRNLPRGIFAKDGAHPSILADLFQFRSDIELLEALETAENPRDYVERVANDRMKERYPNLETQEQQFRDEILKDVHNEKRSEVLRFELQWLAEEAPTVLKEAIRRVSRRVPSNKDVKQYAKDTIGRQTVSKIRPDVYLRAEKNAARDAGRALAKGDLDAAFEKKRIELINHELYKEAVAAKEKIQKSLQDFRKIARADKKLAKTRDIDLINAARSVLAGYGIGDEQASPESFLENMRRYDQETYEGILPLIKAVSENSADYRTISYGDFLELDNSIQALWELSRSSKQMEIDGQKVDRDEIIDQLSDRLSEISTAKEKPGYTRQVTKWQETKMGLLGIRSALRRVESWVDAVDGGNPNGVFRKYIWTPISEGATNYRVQKKKYIQRYLDIVKDIEEELTTQTQDINAQELNYTFSGKAELLGALLHTGNQSNLEKLLRGRNWGDFDENNVLDRSRWDAFIDRTQQEGILTKKDYDYLQSVWDLLEELKPGAQKAHKAMYGYYFSEVSADAFQTPFGNYRGGYVPAAIDPMVSNDQEIRQEKEQLEQFNNSYMFPTSGRGFTKSRVQRYAAPLQMNLRFIPGHIDKVLRFVNIEPHVKDVGKIIMNPGFRNVLNNFDSGIAGDMLVPWLQRSAKQQVETPSQSRGGRASDRFFRALRRNTGLNIMSGNVVNTLQQLTGLSIAMVKVQPKFMRNALWRYVRSPKTTTNFVNEKSNFMSTRTTTNVIEIQNTIDELILDPTKYERAREFAKKHGYFMQRATQNIVDVITWSAKYDQAIQDGATEKEAIRQADSAVRETQGSFDAEDISRFETGSPFVRAFTMFYSYFNMQANLLGSEFTKISRDIGLKKGAGRLLYLYIFGFMIPAVLSEILVQAMSGSYDEDDDDNYLDDTMSYFFGGQLRTATAMFPFVGPAFQAGINQFNDKWYDDRISTSPAVSMIESSVKAPYSVYKAIADDGNKKSAVRDTLSAIGLATGFPVVPLSRPIGYLIDVNEGETDPSGPIDFTRGIITGRSGN